MGLGGWGDGCVVIYEAPSRHSMSGLSWARHVHVLGRHVRCINHFGVVMSSANCVGCRHLVGLCFLTH